MRSISNRHWLAVPGTPASSGLPRGSLLLSSRPPVRQTPLSISLLHAFGSEALSVLLLVVSLGRFLWLGLTPLGYGLGLRVLTGLSALDAHGMTPALALGLGIGDGSRLRFTEPLLLKCFVGIGLLNGWAG